MIRSVKSTDDSIRSIIYLVQPGQLTCHVPEDWNNPPACGMMKAEPARSEMKGPAWRKQMPLHDWTRVDAGIFHDFHQAWNAQLRGALNGGLLPPDSQG